MIWKNATKVGCNLHNGNKMFVCRYKGKDEDEVINNPKEIYNNIQQANILLPLCKLQPTLVAFFHIIEVKWKQFPSHFYG
jgi:hypothetical protein